MTGTFFFFLKSRFIDIRNSSARKNTKETPAPGRTYLELISRDETRKKPTPKHTKAWRCDRKFKCLPLVPHVGLNDLTSYYMIILRAAVFKLLFLQKNKILIFNI